MIRVMQRLKKGFEVRGMRCSGGGASLMVVMGQAHTYTVTGGFLN